MAQQFWRVTKDGYTETSHDDVTWTRWEPRAAFTFDPDELHKYGSENAKTHRRFATTEAEAGNSVSLTAPVGGWYLINSSTLHADEELKEAIAYAREQERSRILAAIQSCAPSDVPYSAAKHEWARLGKKELFAQILKAIEIAHLAADGTSAAPEKGPL